MPLEDLVLYERIDGGLIKILAVPSGIVAMLLLYPIIGGERARFRYRFGSKS